jgi:hypothetical protein
MTPLVKGNRQLNSGALDSDVVSVQLSKGQP